MISLVGFIACFVPLIIPVDFVGRTDGDPSFWSKALELLHSNEVEDSLKACIAVSLPISLNYMLDVISLILRKGNTGHRFGSFGILREMPHFSLIAALTVPIIAMLSSAIPEEKPELFLCLQLSRLLLLYYGVLGQLWLCDTKIFQPKVFLLGYILIAIALVCYCWHMMFGSINTSLRISYFVFVLIGGSFCSIEFLRFILRLWVMGFNRLSINQMNCSVYVILFSIMSPAMFVLSILHPIYDPESCTFAMYMLGTFTLCLTVMQSRVSIYMFHVKEVRHLILFCSS